MQKLAIRKPSYRNHRRILNWREVGERQSFQTACRAKRLEGGKPVIIIQD